MDLSLAGKVAVITGGARGIGFAHAKALGSEGAVIVINDIDERNAQAAVAQLAAAGIEARHHPGDAADDTVAKRVVEAVAGEFGRLDILINNAGIGVNPAYFVEEMPETSWDEMIRVHMRSTFVWSKRVIPYMRARGFGRIINTSSMNFTGGGRPGVANYSAAKAGIVGFTQTLAREVGRYGITVNAIAPGYVATDLISQFQPSTLDRLRRQNPIGRLCEPSEVAAVVAFLCSPHAAFINGECICIDGGRREFVWED